MIKVWQVAHNSELRMCGAAVGMNLLFGIPLWAGGIITAAAPSRMATSANGWDFTTSGFSNELAAFASGPIARKGPGYATLAPCLRPFCRDLAMPGLIWRHTGIWTRNTP